MSENNQMMSVEGQLVGMPLAGPESFSQQQLDYLKRALGVDETVLYNYPSSETVYDSTRKLISFSESCRNFERIRVYLINNDYAMDTYEFEPGSAEHTETFQVNTISAEPKLYVKMTTWVLGDSNLTYRASGSYYINNGGTALVSTVVNKTANYVVPYKVVGIHRIAGGNT